MTWLETASTRERLPDRRALETIDFEHAESRGGHPFKYSAGIHRYPDGRLAELFINCAKVGTALDTAARDGAILASLGLQYGVPPEVMRAALTRNGDGSASGPVGAVLDMLANNP